MEATHYEIKLEQFEGPFDLLLFFIERDELNIHDIPISKITRAGAVLVGIWYNIVRYEIGDYKV